MTIFFLVTLRYRGNRLLSRLSGEEPTCDAGDMSSIPGSGRYAREEMATHSSILAWEIPWTEKPGGVQSMGSQKRT